MGIFNRFFGFNKKDPLSLQEKDQKIKEALIDEGREKLKELQDIDQRLLAIQKSTKITFSFFAPIHNYCRTKYQWYYNWHIKPYATKVHYSALVAVLFFGTLFFSYPLLGKPNMVKAAEVVSVQVGNWNDPCTWSDDVDCATIGTIPASGDNVTIAHNVTLNGDVNIGSGNITINAPQTLDTAGYSLSAHDITINGPLTARDSTITLSGSIAATAAIDYGTSTIVLTGEGVTISNNNVASFYNLTLDGASVTALSNIPVVHDMNLINSASFDMDNFVFFEYNDLTLADGTTWIGDDSSLYFYGSVGNGGDGELHITDNNTVKQNLGDMEFSSDGVSVFFDSDIKAQALVGPGCFNTGWEIDISNRTVTLLGATSGGWGGYPLYFADFCTEESSVALTATNSTIKLTGSGTYGINVGTNSLNNLEIQNGTVATDLALDINGDFTLTSGAYNSSEKNLNIAGNLAIGNGAVFTKSGTLTFDGATASTFADNNASKQNIGTVVFNKTDEVDPGTNNKVTFTTSSLADSITVDGTSGQADTVSIDTSQTLTVTTGSTTTINGTISGAGTLCLTDTAGANLSTSGTLSSRVRFDAATGNVTIPARTYGGVVEPYNGTSTNYIATLGTEAGQTFNFSSDLLPTTNSTGKLTLQASTYNPTVNVAGNFQLVKNSTGVLPVGTGSGTWTVSGSWLTSTGGDWVSQDGSSGTPSAGKLIINGTGNSMTGSCWPAVKFYDLQISGNTTTSMCQTSIYHDLTIDAGITLNQTGGSATISMSSGTTTTLGSGATYSGTGTLRLNGSAGDNLSTNGTLSVANIHFFGGWNTNAKIPARDYNGLVTVSVQDTNSRTVTFGTASDQTINFNSGFKLQDTSSGNLSMTAATYNPTINITGDFTTSKTSTGAINLDMGNSTWNASGNVDFTNITLTANTSTIDFNKSSDTQTFNSGNTALNNVTHSGAGTLQLSTNAINIDGNFVNSNGVFDANNLNVNVAKNWTISGGSFSSDVDTSATTQTVTFDSTNESAISGNNTFNNLTIDTSVDGGKTVNFASGSTQTIVGNITLNGSSGNVLTLGRSGGSGTDVWTLTLPDNYTSGDYISVSNSAVTDPYKITPSSGGHVLDGGNNPGWIFNQNPNSPELTTPLEGAWMSDSTPTFSFSLNDPDNPGGSQQVKYQIQISDDSEFSNIIIDYTSALAAEGEFSFTVGQALLGGSYNDHGSEGQTLTEDTYYWKVKSFDEDDAYSDWVESRTFNVDMSAPSISFTADPALPNGSNDWYISSAPTVSISASSSSPVTNIYYKWDEGEFSEYSTALTLSEGVHTLYAYAENEAGNSGVSLPTSTIYKLDLTDPVVDIYSDPTSANGTNDWYKTTAPTITFLETDSVSGSGTIHYKWDDDEYAEYSNTITVPEGDHTISYYGVDAAGNSTLSSPITRQFKVDTSVPTVSLTIDPADPNSVQSWYKGSSPTISLSANDEGSGNSSIKYQWSNGALTDYSSSFSAPEGSNILTYYSIDNAGNQSVLGSRQIKYDNSSPDVSNIIPRPVSNPTNNLTVTFNWSAASDSGSGVASYLVYVGSTSGGSDLINGGASLSNTYSHAFTAAGTYYIRVKAIDLVGNISSFSSESSFEIDLTLPSVSISNLLDSQYINTKTVVLSGTSSDLSANLDNVSLQFDQAGDWQRTTPSDGYATWNYEWKDYTEGVHTITAKATDSAGNVAYTRIFSVIVDTIAPTLPSDFRVFNISNQAAKAYAVYLDFASSVEEGSGLKHYEVNKNNEKLSEIATNKDSSNPAYTGSINQSYFLIDNSLSLDKYSFDIKAIDNAGNVSQTPSILINTSSEDVIENDVILDLSGTSSSTVTKDKTSAIVSWKTVYPATSLVEYGTSADYGNKTELDESLNQGHSVLIPDLKPNTTYHARVTSKDIYNREKTSEDITFTTKPAPEEETVLGVIIDALKNFFSLFSTKGANAADISSEELKSLQGFSNNLLVTDISFKEKGLYQNILTFEKGAKIEKSTNGTSYSSIGSTADGYYLDKDLSTGTSYYYRSDGGLPITRKPVVGDDSALAISDNDVIKESVFVAKDKVQLTVSWKTNRGATSQVDFGTTNLYGQKTKEDASLNMGHNIIIEDLKPDTAYHFKVTSKDSQGNTAVSGDFTFTTPVVPEEKTPIDIIIETLQRFFDVFRNIF